MAIVGIIGGTGLDQDPTFLQAKELVEIKSTPYGYASDSHAIYGRIEGVPIYLISRHGKRHDSSPTDVNYRANLWALVKQLNCTHILATSACGSLQEKVKPGQLGILDQYMDRTCLRKDRTFYKVCHVEQKNPINKTMQSIIEQSCIDNNIEHHKDLCVVTIEGPRFSTLFESRLYQKWGCDVVNMTSVPEVQLAAELGVIYACILLVTDYDCWKEDEESVNATLVVERMKDMVGRLKKILPGIMNGIKKFNWEEQIEANKKKVELSIMTK